MRYYEIIEAAADAAARESERKRKANEKLTNARRKKSDAARRYQDSLRTAASAEQSAKTTLAGK